MEKMTDWIKLWEDLSGLQNSAFERSKTSAEDDFWKKKAKKYDKMVDERWAKPDSSRDFLIKTLKHNPGSTLLDIGAGTGKWSVLAAPYAGKVTAFEPSSAMQGVLKEKIKKQQIPNIEIVTGTWPDDDIPAHDYVLASHSMYGVSDFKGFVTKMVQTAAKACIMVLRVPFGDAIMAQAAQRVLGQPWDSPNFQVAYNALLSMNIYPHVIMEADGAWPGWNNDSLEAALFEMKNRLGVRDTFEHDTWMKALLEEHLIIEEDKVTWPPGNRSALVYWETDGA